MRTLRLSLAGTVVLVLAGGLSSAVLAQSEADGPAYVTGTQTYIEDVSEATEVLAGDVTQIRGGNATYAIEMDDPRVTGTMATLGMALDIHPGDRFAFGDRSYLERRTGPGPAWRAEPTTRRWAGSSWAGSTAWPRTRATRSSSIAPVRSGR